MEFTFWAFVAVLVASVFAMISVVTWSDNRRKERDSLYKSETLRKLAEQPTESADRVLQYMREEQWRKDRRQREGQKLAGFILLAVGGTLVTFLSSIVRDEPIWIAGFFPLSIGVVLLFYAYVLAPKPESH